MSQKNEIRDLKQLLEESLSNIRKDRAMANKLLSDVMIYIGQSPDRNEKVGVVASKYLETLQRSNEQLVKIAELLRKKESITGGLTEDDREDLFDELAGDDGE